MKQIALVTDSEEPGYSSVQLVTTPIHDSWILHQMNGAPIADGIFMSREMVLRLRDELNKMDM